jgi:uncharacterized protein (TIGR02453 family)
MAGKSELNPFGPGLIKFLRDLDRNNNKTWFEQNKHRYEAEVREPALEFIRLMGPRIQKISKHLVASDKKVGGSLMRIHRDVRFSRDKRPYKTNVGIQFRHAAGKDVHAPGFYFHIDPKSVFLAAGMWHPEPDELSAIREAIADDPKAYRAALRAKAFKQGFTLEGESLKRAPKGYNPEHPLIDDLRRKDHIAVLNLKKKELARADLVDDVARQLAATKPFMAFLTKAVGLPF